MNHNVFNLGRSSILSLLYLFLFLYSIQEHLTML